MKNYKSFMLLMIGMVFTNYVSAIVINIENKSNTPFKCKAFWKGANVSSHKSDTEDTVVPGEKKQLKKKSVKFIKLTVRNQGNVLLYDSSDKDGDKNRTFVIEKDSTNNKVSVTAS